MVSPLIRHISSSVGTSSVRVMASRAIGAPGGKVRVDRAYYPTIVPTQYLDATGSQFIDTGLVLDPRYYEYEAKFMMTGNSGTLSLSYNAWSSSNRVAIIGVGFYNAGRILTSLNAGYSPSTGTYVGWTTGTEITMSLHGTTLTYNGDTYTMTRPTSGTYPSRNQPIFGTATPSGIGERPSARLYYCKIWTSAGVLARDFVPCRRGSEYGLFDNVTNEFYGNAGDGEFPASPDKETA